MTSYLVTGGCGFIGSHLVNGLLNDEADATVRVFDNFTSGTRQRLGAAASDPRVTIIEGDLKDLDAITGALEGVEHVYHFAANPDIAAAMADPTVDFWEGTYLTQNLLEGIRIHGVGRLSYASGSGVYGDRSHLNPSEGFGPLEPVSTYGASKLACEALISAYCHMFGLAARAFRFANVVGDQQTHGVTYDFVRRLRDDPSRLEVLGDGSQEKSYIQVEDVVAAMRTVPPEPSASFDVFNVGTGDAITVRRIADIVIEMMGLSDTTTIEFGTQPRGWKGDVPVVKFDDSKLRARGWSHTMSSEQSIRRSIEASIAETELH